jgi:endonuclease-3
LKLLERRDVLDALRVVYGERGTALNHRNPFELLVAVALSAQTTDKAVNAVTEKLFAAFPTPEALSRVEPEQVKPFIATIGLANTKAKNLVLMARLLLERHGGAVPVNREALMALPGVGRKTANVVLSTGFDVPAIPVDTHVFRVANRLGFADADTVEATEQDLMRTIPRAEWAAAHHGLIWHGREVCVARRPRCESCTVRPWCHFARAGGRWRAGGHTPMPPPVAPHAP